MFTNKMVLVSKILVTAFAVLFAFMITATVILMENKSAVSSFLGAETFRLDNTNVDPNANTEYFASDYKNVDDVMKAGRDICAEVETEGAVLIKNDNNALPFTSDERDISLVSVTSVDPVYVGATGSATKGKPSDNLQSYKQVFEAENFNVNETLWNFYTDNKDTYKRGILSLDPSDKNAAKNYVVGDAPWSAVSTAAGDSFSVYGDAAIVVIGRSGGEGSDFASGSEHTLAQVDGQSGIDYLTLTDTEKTLFEGLAQLKTVGTVKKIVVLINSASAFETEFLNNVDYKIDACMWIGATGDNGLISVPRLLTGKQVPSGRLSDTFYNDNADNPVTANFGNYVYAGADTYLSGNPSAKHFDKYVVYQEGIYVGYRYVETRYEDYVTNRGNAGSFDYSDVVGYTFGYGLSYADFGYSEFKVEQKGNKYVASVKVTNNSDDVTAKEVVQIYLQKPYTEGGTEKSAVELVGFDKTDLLAPKASEKVEIEIDGKYISSYDADDAKTYVVDKGDYYFTAAKDAHDAVNNILAAKNYTPSSTNGRMDGEGNRQLVGKFTKGYDRETYAYSETGAKITNLFDHADINKYEGRGNNSVTWLSRSNWTGTYPDIGGVKLTMTEAMYNDMTAQLEIKGDDKSYPTYGKDSGLQLIDLKTDSEGNDIPFDSALWDTFLDQLTWKQTELLVTNGLRRTTDGLESIGKPATVDMNGPIGLTQAYGVGPRGLAAKLGQDPNKNKYPTAFPCLGILASSFNLELAEKMGSVIGEDALWAGFSGLYGPCSNIHRSPYMGRTAEYYCEDALLSGLMLASQSAGLQKKGCYVYNKHLVLNEQETNRLGVGTWVHEQALRENYLRTFEIPVKTMDAKNIMTSFNRLGVQWTGGDYNLVTRWLRNEVGLTGFIVSDMFSAINDKYSNVEYMLMAGGNLPDGNLKEGQRLEGYESGYGELAQYMRESAHYILYTVLHSNAMNGYAIGTVVIPVTPGWIIAVTVVDIILGVLTVAASVLCVLIFFKRRRCS